MSLSIRIFNCFRCNTQVRICSKCDRGNVYCNFNCADIARKESIRNASKRYQQTQKGKFAHTDRQKLYIKNKLKKEKLTHHGSIKQLSNDVLVPDINNTELENVFKDTLLHHIEHCCHFCKSNSSKFLRNVFLNQHY